MYSQTGVKQPPKGSTKNDCLERWLHSEGEYQYSVQNLSVETFCMADKNRLAA